MEIKKTVKKFVESKHINKIFRFKKFIDNICERSEHVRLYAGLCMPAGRNQLWEG